MAVQGFQNLPFYLQTQGFIAPFLPFSPQPRTAAGPMWPPGLRAPQEREGSLSSACGKSLVWRSTLSNKNPLKPP